MDRMEQTLLDLIRFGFSGQWTGRPLNDGDLSRLYQLAKEQELVHLAADALSKLGHLDGSPWAARFETHLFDAFYRCERYSHAFEQIRWHFEAEKIPFLPLKGLVLRGFYPEEWMRTSCDMDILVRREDLQRAGQILTRELGYERQTQTRHDVSYCSADGVCVELHHTLVEDKRAASSARVLGRVWDYAHPAAPGRYQYVMEDELFYVYHVAHMAKHFEWGGCGIRFVLDLWMMERSGLFRRDRTDELLERSGLRTFADSARALTLLWFEDGPADGLLERMETYILGSGIYGTAEHQYAARQYRAGGKVRYFLSRVFLNTDEMISQYPVLETNRWLLPVCHVHRWWSLLVGKKADAGKDAIHRIQNTTDAQIGQVSDLLTRLGL